MALQDNNFINQSAAKNIVFIIFILLGLAMVSGCGVKPKQVDPPSGATDSTFPRSYPAPD